MNSGSWRHSSLLVMRGVPPFQNRRVGHPSEKLASSKLAQSYLKL